MQLLAVGLFFGGLVLGGVGLVWTLATSRPTPPQPPRRDDDDGEPPPGPPGPPRKPRGGSPLAKQGPAPRPHPAGRSTASA
jgi:hypothetical protein